MLEPIAHAIHEAIKSNPKHLKGEVIAAMMNVGTSTLYSWGKTVDIPLRRLIEFTQITGDLRPLAAACQIIGAALIPLPKVDGSSGEQATIQAVKEFSDFLQETSPALADGKVTAAELGRIDKEGEEAKLAIARIQQLARSLRVPVEAAR